ncbi:MAG: substrate-binding domain-containing protein [Pseudomonadota bacterium]
MKRRYLAGGLAAAVAGVAAYPVWQWVQARRAPAGHNALLVGGASAMYEMNLALGKAFEKRYGVKVIVERGGSLQGLLAAKRHAIDIAAMARDLEGAEAEPQAHNHLVARDAIAIVVNAANPVRQLRQAVVRDVLTGRIDNWKTLGGPDRPIDVAMRPRHTATSRYVSEVVLDGADLSLKAHFFKTRDELLAYIRQQPDTIGCVATDDGGLPADIPALEIDNIPITRETILSGRYPFERSLYLMTFGKARQQALDFIALAESPEGQAIIDHAGFIPVR